MSGISVDLDPMKAPSPPSDMPIGEVTWSEIEKYIKEQIAKLLKKEQTEEFSMDVPVDLDPMKAPSPPSDTPTGKVTWRKIHKYMKEQIAKEQIAKPPKKEQTDELLMDVPVNSDPTKDSIPSYSTTPFGEVTWDKIQTYFKEQIAKLDKQTDVLSIPKDIYSMFFMSKCLSKPFWYSLFTICQRLFLYGVVLEQIYRRKVPEGEDKMEGFRISQRLMGHPTIVIIVTQLLLIPVALGMTLELNGRYQLVDSVEWKKLEAHPHATKRRYRLSKGLRFVDGLTWLVIITSLMLYAVDALGMFLNFAALQFLQEVGKSAYEFAKRGYLFNDIRVLVDQVEKTEFPFLEYHDRKYYDTRIIYGLFFGMILLWFLINLLDK